jgi:hypothetical protein
MKQGVGGYGKDLGVVCCFGRRKLACFEVGQTSVNQPRKQNIVNLNSIQNRDCLEHIEELALAMLRRSVGEACKRY